MSKGRRHAGILLTGQLCFGIMIMGANLRHEPGMGSPLIAGKSGKGGHRHVLRLVERKLAAQRLRGTYMTIAGKEETVDFPGIIPIFHNQA